MENIRHHDKAYKARRRVGNAAIMKALYPATQEISKKWTVPLRNWDKVLGELEIMYADRFG